MKVKEKVKVNGESVGQAGASALATRLVDNINPLGKSSWFALAALAGSLLRLFHRPRRPGTGPSTDDGRRKEKRLRNEGNSDTSPPPVRIRTKCERNSNHARTSLEQTSSKVRTRWVQLPGSRSNAPQRPRQVPALTAGKGGMCHE